MVAVVWLGLRVVSCFGLVLFYDCLFVWILVLVEGYACLVVIVLLAYG